MMTVTIKIENNNLQKAKTEIEALLVTVDALAKTYPTEFNEKTEEVKPKTTRKPRTTKPKAEKVVEEKVVEEKVEKVATTLTLADLTGLAKKAVAGSDRDTVKDLIASFSTSGKLSGMTKEEDKNKLAVELKKLANA